MNRIKTQYRSRLDTSDQHWIPCSEFELKAFHQLNLIPKGQLPFGGAVVKELDDLALPGIDNN